MENKNRINYSQNVMSNFFIIENKNKLQEIKQNKVALPLRIFVVGFFSEEFPVLSEEEYDNIKRGINVNEILYKKWAEFLKRKKNIGCVQINRVPSKVDDIKDDEHIIFKLWEEENKNFIIFDDHGENFSEDLSVLYYEPYINEGIGKLINHISEMGEQKKYFCYELFETAVISVGVIDERIQNKAEEEDQLCKKIITRKVLEKMNIYIPEKEELDLNKLKSYENTADKIKNWIENNENNFDFLIIHLGLIDEFIISKGPKDIDNWIKNNISGFLNKNTEIIIDSDRGTPPNIPINYRFINYSNIIRNLYEERSKYHLIKLLFNSRKIIKK